MSVDAAFASPVLKSAGFHIKPRIRLAIHASIITTGMNAIHEAGQSNASIGTPASACAIVGAKMQSKVKKINRSFFDFICETLFMNWSQPWIKLIQSRKVLDHTAACNPYPERTGAEKPNAVLAVSVKRQQREQRRRDKIEDATLLHCSKRTIPITP